MVMTKSMRAWGRCAPLLAMSLPRSAAEARAARMSRAAAGKGDTRKCRDPAPACTGSFDRGGHPALKRDLGRIGSGAVGEHIPKITITVSGKAHVEPGDTSSDFAMPGGEVSVSPQPIPPGDTSAIQWVTVNLQTGNEFAVTFPRSLLDAADRDASRTGLNLGSREPASEAEERSGAMLARGLSNGVDTRIVRGTYGVAQTQHRVQEAGQPRARTAGQRHLVGRSNS